MQKIKRDKGKEKCAGSFILVQPQCVTYIQSPIAWDFSSLSNFCLQGFDKPSSTQFSSRVYDGLFLTRTPQNLPLS